MMHDLIRSHGTLSVSAGWRAAAARRCRLAPAFSLVELLVVIGIIILVLALAGPAFKKISQGTNITQGQNMITAYLASARALALQRRCSTAVVFFEDAANNYGSQTAIAVVYEASVDTSSSNAISYFAPVPGRPAEYLPGGVKVATLDATSTNSLNTEAIMNGSTQAPAKCRAIVFDSNGRMTVRHGLGTYSSNNSTPPTTAPPDPNYPYMPNSASPAYSGTALTTAELQYRAQWNFNAFLSSPTDVYSSPALLVYDGNQFRDAMTALYNSQGSAPTAAQVSAWIQGNADMLAVNAYTGNVVR